MRASAPAADQLLVRNIVVGWMGSPLLNRAHLFSLRPNQREMRATAWIVIAVLFVAAAVLTWWTSTPPAFASEPTPPGQYPLDARRPEWPATERVRPYSPAAGMGSDAIGTGAGGAAAPPKAVCGRRPAQGCPLPISF